MYRSDCDSSVAGIRSLSALSGRAGGAAGRLLCSLSSSSTIRADERASEEGASERGAVVVDNGSSGGSLGGTSSTLLVTAMGASGGEGMARSSGGEDCVCSFGSLDVRRMRAKAGVRGEASGAKAVGDDIFLACVA